MAKYTPVVVLDQMLQVIQQNAVRMCCTEGEPTVIGDVLNPKLGGGLRISQEITMGPADMPISNEGAGPTYFNRKIDVAAKSPIDVVADGTPDHVVLYSATQIYEVTTITSPPTVDTNAKLSFPTWQDILEQPA